MLASWQAFGLPAQIIAGELAAWVAQRSADLYPARLAWLTEHGVTAPGEREYYECCWEAADRFLVETLEKRLGDEREKAAEKAKQEARKVRRR